MRSFMAALQIVIALPLLLGASTSPVVDHLGEKPVNQEFSAQWQASLCTAKTKDLPAQPYIDFRFHGPITEFFGPLCYHFAGYNETCLPAKKRWLTPATSIELIAPGQVPLELLQGYILLVRFPWLSDELYRYPLTNKTCQARRVNNSS